MVAITFTTNAATEVDHRKAILNGEHVVDAPATIAFLTFILGQQGIAYGANLEAIDPPTTPFEYDTSADLWLVPNMYYEFRVYARVYPTGSPPYSHYYGDVLNFTTDHIAVTTDAVTNIDKTTATANGSVGVDHPNLKRGFEYYKDGDEGNKKYKYHGDLGGAGAYSVNLSSLIADTKYYIRAYCTVQYVDRVTLETSYYITVGDWVEFTTLPDIVAPTVTTQAVTDIIHNSATGNGTITDVGGEDCTKRGICWNTTGNPTIADNKSEETGSFGVGAFTRPITELGEKITYYVKAYAYNPSGGYGYGAQVSFITTPEIPVVTTQAVTDIEIRTATANGTIVSGVEIFERGFEYGLTETPTKSVKEEGVDLGLGPYSLSLTKL